MKPAELSENARRSNAKMASILMYCIWSANAFDFMVVTTSGNSSPAALMEFGAGLCCIAIGATVLAFTWRQAVRSPSYHPVKAAVPVLALVVTGVGLMLWSAAL